MSKTLSRFLAAVLCLLMLVSVMPAAAFAEGETETAADEGTTQDGPVVMSANDVQAKETPVVMSAAAAQEEEEVIEEVTETEDDILVAALDEEPNYHLTTASKSYAQLAPGVKETAVVAYDNNGDRIQYWVVNADVTTTDTVEIKANYHDNDNTGNWGKATVVEQANAATAKRGYNVVASQNAAYYNVTTGQPTGAFVMEGVNINGDSMGNATEFFAQMDDGTYMIGQRGTFSQYSEHVVEAIGGHMLLVWNGELVSGLDNTEKYPRSTIGVTAEGNVIAMMADGNQKPVSAGLTYAEQGQLMLDLGCVAAIELDGGGSATYASKYEGEDEITVRNSCCDGTVRSVSNTFMIISTAVADGTFDHANLATDYAFYAANSTVAIKATGADKGGHDADIPEDVTWTLSDDSFGNVADGVFTSNGKLGTVTVNMNYSGSVVGSIDVTVVNPTSVAFSASEVTVPYGKTIDMSVTSMYNGAEVYAAASAFDIAVSSGTMDGFNYTAPTDESVASATITATYKYAENLVATTTAKFGKGSDVLFDFEDYGKGEKKFDWGTYADITKAAEDGTYNGGVTNVLSSAAASNYVVQGIQEDVQLVDSTTGKVHSGDYALAYTFDYRQQVDYCDWLYGYLYYWGDPITLLDTDNGQMGTRLGMWMYIPEEAVGSCSRLAYTYKQANGTLNTAYLYFTYQYVQKGFSKLTSDKIPEAGWAYVSVDMSQISNTYVSTAYYKDANGNLTRAAATNYAPAFIQWIISSSATGAEKCTFYIDDITLDYSDAVDDRDAPTISGITYADDGMADAVALNGQTASSSKVSFAATVEEDTTHNPTGIDASTAAVYVDGQIVTSKYTATTANKGIFAATVVLPNGTHDVTFAIADKQGNLVKTTKSIVVNAEGSTYPAVYVAGEKLNGTANLKCGEQYNINISTDKAEAISTATTTIWLNSASTWALEHMTVAQGFTAKYTLDEIACKATITLTNESSTLTDSATLVSIPVYNFYYDGSSGVDAHTQWTENSTAPILTLSWDVQYGAVTYKEGYGVSTANYVAGFGKERIDETTELNSSIANLKETIGEWHYHTEVAVDDKAATCTEPGYTGRTKCSDCNSIINWGTTIPAKGHSYQVVDGQLVCSECEDVYTTIGLVDINGTNYYVLNGELQSGWYEVDGDWYYFNAKTFEGVNGTIAANTLITTNEAFNYEFVNGKLSDGVWHTIEGKGTRYYYGPGYYAGISPVAKFVEIHGKTYAFDPDGYKYTGISVLYTSRWISSSGALFDEDGVFQGDFTGEKDGYYFVNGLGTLMGIVKFGDDYYYIGENGVIAKDKKVTVQEAQTNDLLKAGPYYFGTDGKALQGIVDGVYYVNGQPTYAGTIKVDGKIYYAAQGGAIAKDKKVLVQEVYLNDLLPKVGYYWFNEDGNLLNGIKDGYYYVDGVPTAAGLMEIDGDYYCATTGGKLATGTYTIKESELNGVEISGKAATSKAYNFDDDGKMIIKPESEWKQGIVEGVYYVDDAPVYAGIIKIGDDYYYAGQNGVIAKDKKVTVQSAETNDLLKAGPYYFGADGKALQGIVDGVYYVNGQPTYAGTIEVDGEVYYAAQGGVIAKDKKVLVQEVYLNGLLPKAQYYWFNEDGNLLNGIKDGYYYVDGVPTAAGLMEIDGNYYCATTGGKLATGTYTVKASELNDVVIQGKAATSKAYNFDEDGRMIIKPESEWKQGIVDGIYYVDDAPEYAGIIKIGNDYYYAGKNGVIAKDKKVTVQSAETNDLLKAGPYYFGTDGKALQGIVDDVYYVNGQPTYAGTIKVDGKIYYAAQGGAIAKDKKVLVQEVYLNDLLPKVGYYYFGSDGVLVS